MWAGNLKLYLQVGDESWAVLRNILGIVNAIVSNVAVALGTAQKKTADLALSQKFLRFLLCYFQTNKHSMREKREEDKSSSNNYIV